MSRRYHEFIKHKRFMDVCIEVTNIHTNESGNEFIQGNWWNLGQVKSWPIGYRTQWIDMSELNPPDWETLSATNMPANLRTANWVPLS